MENETKKSKLTAKDILAKTGPGINYKEDPLWHR